MSNFFKKNWFVVLMAVAFLGISVFYIYDTNKGKLKGKTVNNQDVVYSVAGQDVTASEFYDEMYNSNGVTTIANYFAQMVADQAVETTDEMKKTAADQKSSIITTYMNNYGTAYKDTLSNTMISLGYSGIDDLEAYLINSQKQMKVTEDYVINHFDELKVRSISYILIKFDDVPHEMDKRSDSEKERMQAVDDAFASGMSFEEVAAQYSEDTSTGPKGGVLGVVDKNTSNLDDAFIKAALELEEGQESDWVYSVNFGYFRIKNNASTPESLQTFVNEQNAVDGVLPETDIDPYTTLLSSYDTTLTQLAIFEKAEQLGVSYDSDPLLEGQLKAMYGIEE